jgi:hypothetical protein
MVIGMEEIGVRGSICASDFMVGAGVPGGVRLPCANPLLRAASSTMRISCGNLIGEFVGELIVAMPAI